VRIVSKTKLLGQSGDTVLCEGHPVTLNVETEGFNLTYNWYQNGKAVQSDISGRLSILNADPGNSGDYKCVISGTCGTIVSDITNLTVHPLTRILSVSPDVKVPFGNDIALDVRAEGHDLIYQWQKDGVSLSNSNTAQLFLRNVNASDIGVYQTIVKGTCGTKISDSVYVYVEKYSNPDATEVFVWPTITSSTLNVAIRNDASYNIQIYSITGKLIKEQTNCQYQTLIDISTLPKGVYIVCVSNLNFRKSIKIIKV
jgi:hypothetical protein